MISSPFKVTAAECDSDSQIRDEGKTQHHLTSSLFRNINQRAEADLINSCRTRNNTDNMLSVINVSVTIKIKKSD